MPEATMGAAIARARQQAGLSLSRVARAAGTSPSHLSRIERGERTGVSADLIERLARELHVDAAHLLAPAGLLPVAIQRELADPALARAFKGGMLPPPTRAALRRLHIASLAEEGRRQAG